MTCNYVSPVHLNYLNAIVYLCPILCIVADIFQLYRYIVIIFYYYYYYYYYFINLIIIIYQH